MQAEGYRIYRVSNTDTCENLDGVLDTLLAFVDGRLLAPTRDLPLSPTLSPEGGGVGEN